MKTSYFYTFFFVVLLFSCKSKEEETETETTDPVPTTPTDLMNIENTFGFGALEKVKGIWGGPFTSSTSLGGFPDWFVDFRPIAENQIFGNSDLDAQNNIQMSFFVSKYKDEYRVCFRNGGMFAGQKRISYFFADSVSETSSLSYYRFSEPIIGKKRAYIEFLFHGDSMIMTSYTNKFNALAQAVQHVQWKSKKQDASACQASVDHFVFPKKTVRVDLSSAFTGLPEAIIYASSSPDPYSDADQPYLGTAQLGYSFTSGFTPDVNKNVFITVTTEPLFVGGVMNMTNLKYRSRGAFLKATSVPFTFQAMHPGTYYLYVFYDADGNGIISSGDRTSTSNTSFVVPDDGSVSASTAINFVIP